MKKLKMNQKQGNYKGFTIVELLIVVVVIAILAAITIVSYNGITTKARDSQRSSDVSSMQKALGMYHADNGFYPSVGSDNAGYNVSLLAPHLVPKYISQIPTSPSGNNYSYVRGTVGNNSYAILMQFESKQNCHVGVNQRTAGWWSMPACETL